MFNFISSKKSIFTLDIGSKYIKAARFDDVDNKLIMTHFEMAPTPPGTVEKGVLVEGQLIHDVLEHLFFHKLKWNKKSKFVTMLTGTSVITKKIEIPKTESKITKEHVILEVSQYLPFEIEDAHYDYIELPFLSKDSSMKSIFFVATNKKTINVYNLCIGNLSINIDVIDTSFFSAQKTLICSHKKFSFDVDENILILDVGFHITGFTVVRNNSVIFSRDLNCGVQSYVSEIQRNLSMDFSEAHDLLVTACSGQSVPDEVMMIVQNHHAHFYRDISMGIEFFLNYFPEDSISKCFISGGGMNIPGLKKALIDKIEINIVDLPIFRSIQTKGFSTKKLKEIQPFTMNCVGMALGLIKTKN